MDLKNFKNKILTSEQEEKPSFYFKSFFFFLLKTKCFLRLTENATGYLLAELGFI